MFEETLLLARALFPLVGSLADAAKRDAASMLSALSAAGLELT